MDGKQKTLNNWETFLSINQMIFDLNKENYVETANLLFNKIDNNYIYSFNLVVSQMIYSFFIVRMNEIDLCLNFAKEIQKFEESNQIKPYFFDVFVRLLFNKYSKESDYIIAKMSEYNLYDFTKISHDKLIIPNLMHLLPVRKIKKLLNYRDMEDLRNNYKELSENNFELHKKLVKEGVNPNEIAKIIRNDEIEKLQEIAVYNDFDVNDIINYSNYDRCSFINKFNKNVSLIDYAAFFSSIKCFKYLLMNGANVKNTGKYAIAGGNLEIIHLCEQNHSSFKRSYETAIRFHRNDVFKYLYENKNIKIKNLAQLGRKCILYNNYEIFSFLLENGMRINDFLINELSRIGNIFAIKHFIEGNHFPHILGFSTVLGNIELVKYILEQEGIDINAKNIYLIYLKFILIILYFKIIFGNYFNYLKQHL